MALQRNLTLALCLALYFTIEWAHGSKLRKQRETTIMKFMKLLFYRLIYGFAKMIGMGEVAEEFGDGVLAPPDSDYRQEDADDDYYDDNKNDDYNYDIY
ncbi:uncharacterized protein LOC112692904 [Sipha flava]|uniref:Uncharacterized protein LOC112692904 n=1 Tax=Sipha flava TaxID=143950 RepID=A0A8B8GM85_9HEMI|nr:uncharacterized protein LOC112692904 [Sipha flava]